jgi:two-component sensor histidine kinase
MSRVSGVTTDITDRKDAETRQALLAREVDHRARNALAVVQAIVRLARADTIEGYTQAVEGRIRALAQTHELLSQSRWQGADVHRLVMEEIAPYRSTGRIRAEGPSMIVAPETAQTVALTLHELATNAAKYGALSSKRGELDISWKLDDGLLKVTWNEQGGSRTGKPTKTGFGMKIILANFSSQQRGGVNFDWRKEGLLCTIEIPCGAVCAPQRSTDRAAANPPQQQLAFGKKLLLVEDEALIGTLIHDFLLDWGFEPSEPYRTLGDALAAAKEESFDGAILDMNLNGEAVYPLADLLASRSIPFVFLTGYGQQSVDRRFAEYPVLQKPVEPEMLKALLRGEPERSKAVA